VLPESPEDEDTSVPLTETPVSETDTAVPETDTPSIKEIVKETIIGLDKSVLSFPADTRQIIIKINELWHISPPEPFTPQWKFWVKSVKELLAACGESDPLIVIDRVYDRWLNGKFTVASPRSLVNTAKFIANNMGLAYWGNDTKKKVAHWG